MQKKVKQNFHSAVLIAIRSVILLLPAILVVAVLLPVGIVALLITALLPVLAIALILAVGLGASSITKRVIERCVGYRCIRSDID